VLAPDLPTDPLFANQYHLRNTAAGQRDLAIFRGDTSAWDEFTGVGVKLGVIDDGVDKAHVDLDDNYDASLETVDGSHTTSGAGHGTSVSGIIAAERNGLGVVGVAYDSDFTMMAAIGASPSITLEQSLDNAKNFDVVNNSWGFTTPWYDEAFNPAQATYYSELDDISLLGRGGLGASFVKSAGNGRFTVNDNSNFSFTTAHWANIAVAAVMRTGVVSFYSTEGAANLVSAFGGPSPGDIWTTDRTGSDGYDAGSDYNSSFNGTSAAAPMVSGIIALMLEANPELGYRDVQDILALTARHTGSPVGGGLQFVERYPWDFNASSFWNGGGMHFSEDYGFGLVDALAAVRLAESWTEQNTRANLTQLAPTSTSFAGPIPIANNSSFNVTFTLAGGVSVEHVAIDLGISHTFLFDVSIQLTSPDGTVSELLRKNGGSTDFPDYGTYDVTLMSTAFRGEDSGGVWTLTVSDDFGFDSGMLSAVNFYITGGTGADDVHVLTEEYSDYANASRQTIEDTNGGVDTLNASAVFSASVIDLGGGASTVDGVAFTTDGAIEHAVGGDGDDSISGGSGANWLRGSRGTDLLQGGASNDILDGGADDDLLQGGANNDTLDGGAGDDLLQGGTGGDSIAGGLGVDTIDYSEGAAGVTVDLGVLAFQNTGGSGFDRIAGVENLIGTNAVDHLTGDGNANRLTGLGQFDDLAGSGGADTLDGGQGSDSLTGGAGDDLVYGGFGSDTMAGGTNADTLDYSLLAGETFLDISIAVAQNTHSGGNDTLIGFENMITGAGDDRLFGSGQANNIQSGEGADTIKAADGADVIRAAGGEDRITGGGGGDSIWGGDGRDFIRGGVGGDTFDFDSSTESGVGLAACDVVRDFQTAQGDKFDFADLYLATFAYIGAGAFGGIGDAEVRVDDIAEGQLVQVDINGDGGSDLDILVANDGLTGGAGDFVL
jgi:Ca2+-binding RTX toxin-like protein